MLFVMKCAARSDSGLFVCIFAVFQIVLFPSSVSIGGAALFSGAFRSHLMLPWLSGFATSAVNTEQVHIEIILEISKDIFITFECEKASEKFSKRSSADFVSTVNAYVRFCVVTRNTSVAVAFLSHLF